MYNKIFSELCEYYNMSKRSSKQTLLRTKSEISFSENLKQFFKKKFTLKSENVSSQIVITEISENNEVETPVNSLTDFDEYVELSYPKLNKEFTRKIRQLKSERDNESGVEERVCIYRIVKSNGDIVACENSMFIGSRMFCIMHASKKEC